MPTIIFKETEACNSNCIYCNVIARKRPNTISLDLLKVVFSRVDEYLKSKPNERIEIIWHGGEPCIVGIHFYENVLDILDTICSSTKTRIDFNIQSNLTLITQDLLNIFKAMGIKMIGTSFEPYKGIRGIGQERDSDLYNTKFYHGLELLEENNMPWGFIYVVTKAILSKPVEIFHILDNFSCCRGFDLHAVYGYKHQDPNGVLITPKEFADFLGALCPIWWEHKDRYPRVDPFESYYEKYTKRHPQLVCTDSNCAYSHLYIGPNGELSHCGRSSEWDVFDNGNIKDVSIEEAFRLPYREILNSRNQYLDKTECAGCSYFKICHGGCPLDGWNNTNNLQSKSEWCYSTKYFLSHYFEPITGLSLSQNV